MNRTEKSAAIAETKARFDRAISVALVDFTGLTVDMVSSLRREFRKAGVEYKVVKNTVIRHALKDSAYKPLIGDLSSDRKNAPKAHAAVRGMTGVAWSYSDPAAPAKVIETFNKTIGTFKKKASAMKVDKIVVKTGLVGGSLVPGDVLAKMPGLKETQGMIVGLLDAPGAQLYAMLQTPAATIVAILDTWVAKQKGEGA